MSRIGFLLNKFQHYAMWANSSFLCDLSQADKLDLRRMVTGQRHFQVLHSHLEEAWPFSFCMNTLLLEENNTIWCWDDLVLIKTVKNSRLKVILGSLQGMLGKLSAHLWFFFSVLVLSSFIQKNSFPEPLCWNTLLLTLAHAQLSGALLNQTARSQVKSLAERVWTWELLVNFELLLAVRRNFVLLEQMSLQTAPLAPLCFTSQQ